MGTLLRSAVVIAAAIVICAIISAARDPVIVDIDVTLKDLPSEAEG